MVDGMGGSLSLLTPPQSNRGWRFSTQASHSVGAEGGLQLASLTPLHREWCDGPRALGSGPSALKKTDQKIWHQNEIYAEEISNPG